MSGPGEGPGHGPDVQPVERLFADVARHPRSFWLDGGGAREWSGRRSLLGTLDDDDVSLSYDAARREVTRHRRGRAEVVGDDVFTALADAVAADAGDPDVHWIGWFGYAARPDLPALVMPSGAPGRAPDAVWMRTRHVRFVTHAAGPEPARLPPPPDEVAVPTEYRAAFGAVAEQLAAGNTYEVNLTYRRTARSHLTPADAYLRLRAANPAPYAGFLQHLGTSVLSSSPERFATLTHAEDPAGAGHRLVETKPIKGTTPRGTTAREDERLRDLLRTDAKLRAENLMITDLLRNDLAMVCEPGTVQVPVLMGVETYPHVHQLVSTVRGRLRGEVGTVEALRRLFPAGSMTGAPKLRTMSVIADVESSPRGVYAGALGWISADGRADLGVVIRTLVHTDGLWEVGTGGGITVRSELEAEYAETRWKADRLLAVLG